MNIQTKKESDYKTTLLNNMLYVYILVVLVSWGVVPLFAKSVNLPGGTTTMIVNWSALFAIFAIMAVFGKLWQFSRSDKFLRFASISFVWPLMYSITYFGSIKTGSASLTTLLNYTWPLFAALFLYKMRSISVSKWAFVSMAFSVVVLGTMLILENNIVVSFIPIALGITAAIAQAFFNIETESDEYPSELAWLLTFIGALVTAVGSTVYVYIFETVDLSGLSFNMVWPLLLIGAVSNGLGFWAFLKAIKLSANNHKKINFWFGMMLVPVVQVALVIFPGFGIEEIGWPRVVALAVICLNFFIYKRWEINSS